MKDDIIKWAREAGFMFCEESYKHRPNCLFYGGYAVDEQLQRFAVLVEDAQAKRMHDEGMVTVGHMREQIAAEREAIIQRIPGGHSVDPQWVCDMIRARGQA
jgi:hypothetical protein